MAYWYNRFEETLTGVKVCLSFVEDHINDEALYPTIPPEIKKFRDMIDEFWGFMKEHALINFKEEELDQIRINAICRAMENGRKEEN